MSSLLGHYALLYGPQILLLMNIFYYLPSIPLLLFSAFCDEWLDRTFGERLPPWGFVCMHRLDRWHSIRVSASVPRSFLLLQCPSTLQSDINVHLSRSAQGHFGASAVWTGRLCPRLCLVSVRGLHRQVPRSGLFCQRPGAKGPSLCM